MQSSLGEAWHPKPSHIETSFFVPDGLEISFQLSYLQVRFVLGSDAVLVHCQDRNAQGRNDFKAKHDWNLQQVTGRGASEVFLCRRMRLSKWKLRPSPIKSQYHTTCYLWFLNTMGHVSSTFTCRCCDFVVYEPARHPPNGACRCAQVNTIDRVAGAQRNLTWPGCLNHPMMEFILKHLGTSFDH